MDNIVIGLKLTQIREEKGFTQEQVAKKASLNLSDYKDMEQGKDIDNFERLYKACNALDCKVIDLFDLQPNVSYNYCENFPGGGNSNSTVNNYQRDEDDVKMLSNMSETLKSLIGQLDILTASISKVANNMDDKSDKEK